MGFSNNDVSSLQATSDLITAEKFCKFEEAFIYTKSYNYENQKDEAIVFLHGLCGNHKDGSFLLSKRNKFLTITMDMPNHGQSGKFQNLSWDTYIDAIMAVIASYNIKKVHFVGHSLGADTAMVFAKKYPEYVENIILLDRGYYNFSDLIEYNFTPSFYKVVEYSPESGLDYRSFETLINMLFEISVNKTSDIEKDVLLLAANPYWVAPVEGKPNIIDYIAIVKESPSNFNVPLQIAASLPDLKLDNLNCYMEFLKEKISEFENYNKRFYAVQTPFEHAMINNQTAKTELAEYILEFIENSDKNLAKRIIEEKIKNNEKRFKTRSVKNVLNYSKEV